VLDVMLLALFSAVIYVIAAYMPRFLDVPENEMIDAKNQFLTARAALTVPVVDVTQQVKDRYEELKRLDRLPPDYTQEQIIAELTKQAQLAQRAAGVGESLVWEFDNVKPLSESMFVRFKYDVYPNPPDSQVYGRWFAGDAQSIKYGQQAKTPIFDEVFKHAARTFNEIEFPAEVVPESGRLAIAFQNVPANDTTVIFPPDGLEVLYKADSFTANFIRAGLMILCRLVFLACLGILASSFLSFPVAILFCLVLFFTASFSGFVIESFDYLSASVGVVYSYTLKWAIRLLPQFDKYNPTSFIVPARLLTWTVLAQCAFFMVCIKAFLLLALGLLIFAYREMAKIIV